MAVGFGHEIPGPNGITVCRGWFVDSKVNPYLSAWLLPNAAHRLLFGIEDPPPSLSEVTLLERCHRLAIRVSPRRANNLLTFSL
jgi:hypothetical protein